MSTTHTKAETPLGRATMSSGLEFATNYHRWSYEWIRCYVSGQVLDIGGGTGNHLGHLNRANVVSIDLSSDAVQELRTRYRDLPNWKFEVGDITDPHLIQAC